MSEPAAAPRPDVTRHVRGARRLPGHASVPRPTLVGGIAPGDAERVALIANYYENILSFLEAHHDGEEQLVFPLLRERCAGDGALIDRMDEQHHEALALLEEAKAALGRLARRATPRRSRRPRSDWTRCARTCASISTRRRQKCCRWPRSTSPCEEWGALPGHGMANFHGDKIWLILGLIRERMNDEQRAAMIGAHAAARGRDVDRVRRAGLQGLCRRGRRWRSATTPEEVPAARRRRPD